MDLFNTATATATAIIATAIIATAGGALPVLAQATEAVQMRNTSLDFGSGFAAEARCLAGRTTFGNDWGWSASGQFRACGVTVTHQWTVSPTVTVGPVFGVYAGGGSYSQNIQNTWGVYTQEIADRGSISLGMRAEWAMAPRWTATAEAGGMITGAEEVHSWNDFWGVGSSSTGHLMLGAYAELGVAYQATDNVSFSVGVRHQRTRGEYMGGESTALTIGGTWRF